MVQCTVGADKYPNRRALPAQQETPLYGCDPADTRIHPTRRQKPDKSHGIFAHSHKRTTEACLRCTSVPVRSQPATRVQSKNASTTPARGSQTTTCSYTQETFVLQRTARRLFLFADAKDAVPTAALGVTAAAAKPNGIFWDADPYWRHSNYRLSTAACFESKKTAAKSKNIRHLLPVVHKIYLTP